MAILPPTALTNSAITQTTFTGSWTPPTGTPAATGYNVLISPDGVTDTYLDTVTGTSYDFTKSTPSGPLFPAGSSWVWSVQAFGGDPTEYSDLAEKSVTLTQPTLPPGQVAGAPVDVVRGGLRVVGTMKVVRGGALA